VSGESRVSSARIEVVQVDLRGRINAPGVNLLVPLDGPPAVEFGAFVEWPAGRAASDGVWTVAEDGRPPRTWHRVGDEMVNGTSCVKLIGEQQSEDWDKPRADRGAWRRADTVWIAPRLGVAFRVERLIERREPAQREATHKLTLRYELDSSLQYPGQLSEDRRQEILRARSFGEAATPLLLDPVQYGGQLTALISRINLYADHQPQTPYRDAILYLRRQLEAARRGERPAVVSGETADQPTVATIGLPAPDFIAPDLTAANGGTSRLRDWVGHPVLLVFYSPTSPSAEELLRFARAVNSRFHGGVTVVGLSVSEDAAAARRQRAELNLGFPVLSGNGLRISYSVETTPKMVLIDAAGVVRGAYVGWGGETPDEVVAELRKCLRHP
jgi:peroxiredoxin